VPAHLSKDKETNARPDEGVLEKRIASLTKWAWRLVFLGVVLAFAGIAALGGLSSENLGDFGSFLQGAVGSLWSLSAVFFVYVAFLGQRLQLLYQQVQLSALRTQMATQDTELKRATHNQRRIIQIMGAQEIALHAMARLNGITQLVEGYEAILSEMKALEMKQGYSERLSLKIGELEQKRFHRVNQLEAILAMLETVEKTRGEIQTLDAD